MRTIAWSCFLVVLASPALAQSPDPPLSNKRLTIHTLVREDIFAGWRADNMERFERGEKNIDVLLEQRPQSRADLLAWKGGATLYRAVLAHEAGDEEEFQRLFKESRELFAEAKKLAPMGPGVCAVVGGSYVVFGDRLPEEHRNKAWSEAYDNYQVLWGLQGKYVDRLPPHIGGELLAGLIQSSQRTGRTDEYAEYLDKMIEAQPNTPYGRVAKRWKANPEAAAKGNISCKMCHSEGRLSSRLAQIEEK